MLVRITSEAIEKKDLEILEISQNDLAINKVILKGSFIKTIQSS